MPDCSRWQKHGMEYGPELAQQLLRRVCFKRWPWPELGLCVGSLAGPDGDQRGNPSPPQPCFSLLFHSHVACPQRCGGFIWGRQWFEVPDYPGAHLQRGFRKALALFGGQVWACDSPMQLLPGPLLSAPPLHPFIQTLSGRASLSWLYMQISWGISANSEGLNLTSV